MKGERETALRGDRLQRAEEKKTHMRRPTVFCYKLEQVRRLLGVIVPEGIDSNNVVVLHGTFPNVADPG